MLELLAYCLTNHQNKYLNKCLILPNPSKLNNNMVTSNIVPSNDGHNKKAEEVSTILEELCKDNNIDVTSQKHCKVTSQ